VKDVSADTSVSWSPDSDILSGVVAITNVWQHMTRSYVYIEEVKMRKCYTRQ